MPGPLEGEGAAQRSLGVVVHLPAVAQPGRDAIDGQEDGALDLIVGFAAAPAPQQLDLQMVERVQIR